MASRGQKNTGQQIAARILKKARQCYDPSSVAAGGCRKASVEAPTQAAPSCSPASAAIRVALSLGEVVRRALARKRSPYPFGMGYIQADSRARFSHCSTFTPLIKSHKANNNSPTHVRSVNWLIVATKLGKTKNVTLSIR